MSKIDLLSVGDASLDVFIDPSESEALCRLDGKECLICFSYGDKIPVKHLQISIGGNAANNAVGTKRLGVTSAAVLTLGGDEIGDQIVKRLKDEGVDITFVVQQPSTASNYSTVINYSGERTIFSYKSPRTYQFPVKIPKVSWLYLTSMGDSFGPFYKSVVDWMRLNPEVKLAFNPGSRQLRAGVDAITDVIKISHIIYINRKEAEMITGLENTRGKERDLLSALVQMGVKMPIVTDGANGSFVFDDKKCLKCGILPIDAHERTGAGDAFGAGCVAALIKGKTFEDALVWGTVNSASVIGYTGGQKGLLKESEIDTWLERAKSCNVKVEEI